MDLLQSFRFYQERFHDTGDFTFIFVGNIEPDRLSPLVKTYIASLPGSGRTESWRGTGIEPPSGEIRKTVHRGVEPKSQVRIVLHGGFEWSRQQRYDFNAMIGVLRIKLREVLREDQGGTYGVRLSGATDRYPDQRYRVNISFGCAPERVGELTDMVFVQIDSLKSNPVDPLYVQKVQESQRRTHELNLERNRYWMSSMEYYLQNGIEPEAILDYPGFVDNLKAADIQQAAKKYLDLTNRSVFVLYPEAFEGSR